MPKKLHKYEKDLLIGTIITLFGVVFLFVMNLHWIICWMIIIVGKIIIIFSVMEYVDYRRSWRGEDLSTDNQFKKMIREIRKARYS